MVNALQDVLWMELVTECRQSVLTDAAWCHEHGISHSCFYNAVAHLCKKTCQIPELSGKVSILDFTSHKQDVVQIAIQPHAPSAELISIERNNSLYLHNSHTIEFEVNGLRIHMNNDIQPILLRTLMDAIYIVCGRTDMRRSIDGLCAIIQDQFSMEIGRTLSFLWS